MLILNQIQNCQPTADYNFFIVRSAKSIPKGFHHVPQLSPPKKLFFQVQKWKKEGLWPDMWDEYRNQFIAEMETGELGEYLGYLEELLNEGCTVQLVCFCPDPSRCHRTIIGDYFLEKGYDVDFN